MKKQFKLYLIVILMFSFIFILSSCNATKTKEVSGSGELTTKEIVDLLGNEIMIRDLCINKNNKKEQAEVYFYSANQDKKIVITSQKEILDKITIKTKGNEIQIYGGKREYYTTTQLKVEVYGYLFEDISLKYMQGQINGGALNKDADIELNELSNIGANELNNNDLSIELSGTSKITLSDSTITDLDIEASGASTVNMIDMEIGELSLEMSGASFGTFYGYASEFKAELSGASSLDAKNFTVESAALEMSGASRMNINVNKTLGYTLSGASYLIYVGDPKIGKDGLSGGSQAVQQDSWK